MEKFPDLILDFTVIFGNKELLEDFNEISIKVKNPLYKSFYHFRIKNRSPDSSL